MASTIRSPYANNQWLIDGWKIPLWYKDEKSLKRLWIVAVLDSHSRKIVGYHIDTSERLTSIKKALENAVKETQSFAHELVQDNHSASNTEELKNFYDSIKDLGGIITNDSNPQRKGKLEREFQFLDNEYYRYEYGWIGTGIRSKRESGRPKPESLANVASNPLTKNQIIQITIRIIETYNNTPRKLLGNKSPNQVYQESEKPHSIPIDDLTRLQIFTTSKHYKVNRGMITVTRGITKMFFGYLEQWEGKTLEVYTANDYETLLVTHPKTGKLITELAQLEGIHPDIISQTKEDIIKKNAYARHIKAVKKQREENLTELGKKAKAELELLGIPTEGFNPLTHKKSQLIDTEVEHRIGRVLEEYDINPEMIPEPVYTEDPGLKKALSFITLEPKKKPVSYHIEGSCKVIDPNNQFKD